MGDQARMAKAQRELEELYSGVPDDSVNLTFGDLADVRPPPPPPTRRKTSPPAPLPAMLDPIIESAAASPRISEVTPLAKLPSLDFSRALEASAQFNNINNRHNYQHNNLMNMHQDHHPVNNYSNVPPQIQMSEFGENNHHLHQNHDQKSGYSHHQQQHHGYGHRPGSSPYGTPNSVAVYDDMSGMSGGFLERGGGGGGRRRPGIPHSKICTVCSTYVYVFRHRCLVCGRVYCRQCVNVGMGEMSEGRKCIDCLGRRFSPRYIQKAGQVGCCTGYPSLVKQQELKWAEKGPRSMGENRQGRSEMMSRSMGPSPMIPGRGPNHHSKGPPSFVSNAQASFVVGSPSPYSPYYSPRNHPLPF